MENLDPKEKAKEDEYARSGMMMLITIAILFIVIIVMLCLHMHVRWFLLRNRHSHQHPPRRNTRNRHRSRSRFIFYVDPALTTASRGLDASVIASLPLFTFSRSSEAAECAVCLSEFEEGETGRVLPKCKHSFHVECIDMWFESHSTCPLCRVHVEVPVEPEVIVNNNVSETEPGSNSEDANSNSSSSTSSSSSSSFKSVGEESSSSSYESATSSFRLSMSRMLSLKRILSREKKELSSSVAELDVERGGDSVS
ncbi:hypothetical protein RIF29_07012 [Crotalaria pallida]|uniref:RING-type E3 ubiquitin transferase n=1 Tax=Crotalaria pallida TaxID=3830 RepID=A0AAN9PAM3_CROPI